MSDSYVIGLTGNIATGKSTVARMLGKLGSCVIDADKLAHRVMAPEGEVYERIVCRFGRGIVAADGSLDRAALGKLVFSDPEALSALEAIVHPPVVKEALRRAAACPRPVAVIEAIKLLETDMQRACDAVWVVRCQRRQQLKRLTEERHMSVETAERRIAAQGPQEAKCARADVIIDNSGDLEDTWQQVLTAWNEIPGVPRHDSAPAWQQLSRKDTG